MQQRHHKIPLNLRQNPQRSTNQESWQLEMCYQSFSVYHLEPTRRQRRTKFQQKLTMRGWVIDYSTHFPRLSARFPGAIR